MTEMSEKERERERERQSGRVREGRAMCYSQEATTYC